MKRLSCLLLSNNRISRLDYDVPKYLPNLSTLILSGNLLQELGDLDPLFGFKQLEYLSLLDNPVTTKKYYREYLVYQCPKLRVLDFVRIKDKVR
jgi:U2 small nuclear ribonucleoprotein A'